MPASRSNPFGTTVVALREELIARLRALVPAGASVALLDFPEYGNVGDSLIWLGEHAALRACGAHVRYGAGQSTFDASRLRRRLGPEGIVLLSGGGNFGDLWPAHQVFRERVVSELDEFRILQLPQSVHFDSPAALERARRVLGAHPRFSMLVRDRRSLDVARRDLGVDAGLCPDAAFGLGPLPRPVAATASLVRLLRGDKEAGRGRVTATEGTTDWVDDPRGPMVRLGELLHRLRQTPVAPGPAVELWWMRAMAEARLRRGSRLLARGQAVVTDRLHGHILCMLLGIPHVVLDTEQGKVSAFIEAWVAPRHAGLLCATEAEALRRVAGMVHEQAEPES